MPTFVVGDVHGHREQLVALLHGAGLLDAAGRWVGADARLWLTGDLVDRGPEGLGTIELVMRLEQAGDVHCLLGNHEVLLLGVDRHRSRPLPGLDVTFGELWHLNGGRAADLRGLDDRHRAWLRRLPALARDRSWLLLHADTDRYLELGATVEHVRANATALLDDGGVAALARLLEIVSDRGGLADPTGVDRLLGTLGGTRIVHGHTPIALARGVAPGDVAGPLVSADGRVTNVDHCLFGGGSGFVVELSALERGEQEVE